MATLTPTNGKMTKFSVSTDGSAWEEMCILGDLMIDFGTEALNKEYCINQKDPILSTGNTDYQDITYLTIWSEDMTTAKGLKIIKDAAVAPDIAGKTIHVQVEMNNSKGTSGTKFEYEAMVAGYTVLAKEGEIVKAQFILGQTTTPVETAATA